MNVVAAALPMALSCCALLGNAVSASDLEPAASDLAPERILFIGNSHTRQNVGMDWLVGQMVAAADPEQPYAAKTITENGVTLEWHYDRGAAHQIRSGGYDTVVLQGYLDGSSAQTATSFLEHARLLHEEVDAAGARTVFYMTWPQGRFGWADLDDIVSAHRQVEQELAAEVAPAGLAFELAKTERPDLVLIRDDGVHATWEGAYLAALTIYAVLYDRDPQAVEFDFGVPPEDADFLQRIAAEALTIWASGRP